MTQVVLVRPGATVYDEQNRIQGVLELPLTERGRAEVQVLIEQLRGLDFDALYCGPGESVVSTAEALARTMGLRARKIDELRNLNQGLWQGLQVEEIKRRNPRVYRQWLDEPMTICPPLGETIEDALDRVKSLLKPLLKRHRDETIALVVPEPLARLISLFLRRDPAISLEELNHTGSFEQISVTPEVLRNGESP